MRRIFIEIFTYSSIFNNIRINNKGYKGTMKLLKKSDRGFTIIEVLIVLVIASSILLIVFLAVPQLQRNSRNTQRRSGIASIAGAINEYAANNSAALPTQISGTANPYKLCGSVCTGQTFVDFNMGYYPVTGVSIVTTIPTTGVTNDTVIIVNGGKCGTGADSGKAVEGSARSAAILYGIENAGTAYTPACTDV